MYWHELKQPFQTALGLSNDALHVHFGLALFVLAVGIFRRARGWPIHALLTVLAIGLINEIADASDWIRWTGQPNWRDSLGDLANTLFWPTAGVLWWQAKQLWGSSRSNPSASSRQVATPEESAPKAPPSSEQQ